MHQKTPKICTHFRVTATKIYLYANITGAPEFSALPTALHYETKGLVTIGVQSAALFTYKTISACVKEKNTQMYTNRYYEGVL